MTNNRLETLDSLRGIAALIVVLYHFTTRYYELFNTKRDFEFSFIYGHYGVEIFFIISGFVIFLTLTRTKSSLDFISSRFIRLFPTYWISVTLSFIVISIFSLQGREVSFSEYLINLSMIHLELGIKSVDGVYWTLLYELKFYFLMLILYYFNFLKKVDIIAFLFLVLIIVLNLFSFEETIIYKILNKVFIFNFLYLFIAGIMFYKIMNKEFNIIVFINLILSFYISVDNKDSSNFVIFTFIYIMFLFLSLNKLNFINSKFLIFLGSISYSLYLIHQNIGYIILNTFKENNISLIYGTMTSLICVIILATMITYLFEKPIIVNLKKLYKKRKKSKIC